MAKYSYYAMQEWDEPTPQGVVRFAGGIAEIYGGGGKWIESAPMAGWVITGDGTKGPIREAQVKALMAQTDARVKARAAT